MLSFKQMGKFQLSLFLFIAFVLVSIFGFFAMGNEMDHGNCIAKTLQGTACTETDIFGVAAYHLSAFAKAGRAVVSGAIQIFLTLVALFAAFYLLKISSGLEFLSASFVRSSDNFRPPQKLSLWRWLSFHENSPNLPVGI